MFMYFHVFSYVSIFSKYVDIFWYILIYFDIVLFSCICRNKIRPQELTGFDGFTVLCKCYTMVCSWYSIVFYMINYLIEYFISILVSTTSLSRICFHNISSTHEYRPKEPTAGQQHTRLSLSRLVFIHSSSFFYCLFQDFCCLWWCTHSNKWWYYLQFII